MERKEFIVKTGAMITAVALLSSFKGITGISKQTKQNNMKNKRPSADDFSQPIMKAISFGINAPNPHNTQAWKMRITSDVEMLLYIDENRLLPATDPPTRQIHIGSGCFIETLRIGALGIGYETKITYFPEGPYELEDIGKKPVAQISLSRKENIEKSQLFPHIFTRQTNRKSYHGPMVTTKEFNHIMNLVSETHSEIITMNDYKKMQPFLDIFSNAMRIEANTSKHLWEETRIWMRWNKKDRLNNRDGLSVPQSGVDGLKKIILEGYLKNGDPKRWFSERVIESSLKAYTKGIKSSKGLVFFKTDSNTSLDWVKTGRDFARFHLAATELNMYLHPYSQVLQEYEEMDKLNTKFNKLFNISNGGKVQMAVRIGRGDKPYLSYRRNVKDYLKE
ncbi:Acg family FMN-binding oxidoreductase [Xanthovirga aplysinae]|uniref:Acg family FMN-binding oxidoreductase n=1 Tax=Xanthovirga aplysinae TaxID=2529853 RepID=UPI0012BD5D4A|nr:hypothetical protein [Xanthovirga aplysinae]MTI30258.1 hypothetical protein [Xanthovirga aplysinae]